MVAVSLELLPLSGKLYIFRQKTDAKALTFPAFRINERKTTVKPLLSSPLLNGHLSNSQKAVPLFTVNLTSIKRSPLLSGRGHYLQFPIG